MWRDSCNKLMFCLSHITIFSLLICSFIGCLFITSCQEKKKRQPTGSTCSLFLLSFFIQQKVLQSLGFQDVFFLAIKKKKHRKPTPAFRYVFTFQHLFCLFNVHIQQKFSFLQDATSIRFCLVLILWVYYRLLIDFHYTNTDFNSILFSFSFHLNFILLVCINTAISTDKTFTNIYYRSV